MNTQDKNLTATPQESEGFFDATGFDVNGHLVLIEASPGSDGYWRWKADVRNMRGSLVQGTTREIACYASRFECLQAAHEVMGIVTPSQNEGAA